MLQPPNLLIGGTPILKFKRFIVLVSLWWPQPPLLNNFIPTKHGLVTADQ